MNPGDTTARWDNTPCWRTLNEGRGMNPGDTGRARGGEGRSRALNEGRGMNLGDTGGVVLDREVVDVRSTKAEV